MSLDKVIPIPSRFIIRRFVDGPVKSPAGLRLYKSSPDAATIQLRRTAPNEYTSAPLTVDQLRELHHTIALILIEDFGVSP